MLVKRAGSVLLLPKAVLLIRNRRIRVKGSTSLDTDPHHWIRIRITGYGSASLETDPYHWIRMRLTGYEFASVETDPYHWKRIRNTGYGSASLETDPYHWKRISLSGLAKDFVLQGRSITSQSEPVFLKCPRIG